MKMFKKWKTTLCVLLSILSLIIFLFLKHNNNERIGQELNVELLEKIGQYENGSIKEIDFSTIARFPWDTLYIFGPYSSCNQIVKTLENTAFWIECKLIGIESLEYKSLFVFTKNKKVVQYSLHEVSVTNSDFTSTLNKNGYSFKEAVFILDEGRMIWIGGRQ